MSVMVAYLRRRLAAVAGLCLLVITALMPGPILSNTAAWQLHRAVLAEGMSDEGRAAALQASEEFIRGSLQLPGQSGDVGRILMLAAAQEAQGNDLAAAGTLERALAANPGMDRVRRDLAKLYTRLGDLQKASQQWWALGNPRLVVEAAKRLEAGGKTDQALVLYEVAQQMAPGFAPGYMGAAAAFIARGDVRRGQEIYKKALETLPGEVDIYAALADSSTGADRVTALQSCVTLATAPGNCHYRLGDDAQRAGRYPEAEVYYRAAAKAMPASGDSWDNLGHALFAQRRYGEAVASYREAEERGNHPVWRLVGPQHAAGSYLAMGDSRGAIEAYQRMYRAAQKLARDDRGWVVTSLLGLAQAYAADENKLEAASHYRQVIAIEPDNSMAADGLLQLERG